MNIAEILLRLVLGLVIGFAIGLTGIGAGVLVMSALVSILHLPASVAVGTASLCAVVTKGAAAWRHAIHGNVDRRATGLLLTGALPGLVGVSYWVNRTVASMAHDPVALAVFEHQLGTVLVAVVIAAAAFIIFDFVRNRASDNAHAAGLAFETRHLLPKAAQAPAAVFGGFCTGAVMGGTSISGVIIVPLIMNIFCLSPRKTVGSAIIIALVLSVVTALMYGRGGQIDYVTAIVMGLGALVGATIGARYTARIPRRVMRMILVGLVCTACTLMLIKPGTLH